MITTNTVVIIIVLCIALICDWDLFTEAVKKKKKPLRNDTVIRMRNKEDKREFYLKTNPEHFRVFYSYKDVMKVLTDEKYKNLTKIQDLLADYHKYINPRRRRATRNWLYEGLNQSLIKLSPTKREYPFILVEGMQRNLRRKMARMLAKDLGATYFRTIPRLMKKYHRKFMKWIDLKRAVVALGFYVLSHELVPAMEQSAIVMSGRYWINQAAWYIARKYVESPPPDSPVYQFPTDLVQPDLVFFFNSERITMKEDPELVGVYDRLATAYNRIRGPEIIELNDTYNRLGKEEIESMRGMIRQRLQPKFEHLIL